MLFLHWLLLSHVLFSISVAAPMDDKEPKGKAKGNGKLERVNFPITWTIGETIPDRIVKPIELGAIYWLKPEELVSPVFSFEQLRNLMPA